MDTVESYADLGRKLWRQGARNLWGGLHGPACPDLACADLRAAVPTVIDDRRVRSGHSDEACWRMSATRLGIPFAEYRAHIEAGEKFCCGHRRWESRFEFGRDRRARDGRNNLCSEAAAQAVRQGRERRAS